MTRRLGDLWIEAKSILFQQHILAFKVKSTVTQGLIIVY